MKRNRQKRGIRGKLTASSITSSPTFHLEEREEALQAKISLDQYSREENFQNLSFHHFEKITFESPFSMNETLDSFHCSIRPERKSGGKIQRQSESRNAEMRKNKTYSSSFYKGSGKASSHVNQPKNKKTDEESTEPEPKVCTPKIYPSVIHMHMEGRPMLRAASQQQRRSIQVKGNSYKKIRPLNTTTSTVTSVLPLRQTAPEPARKNTDEDLCFETLQQMINRNSIIDRTTADMPHYLSKVANKVRFRHPARTTCRLPIKISSVF